MIDRVPFPIRESIADYFLQAVQAVVTLINFRAAAGGCINHGGELVTSRGNYFLKWNDKKKFPGMFVAEAKGLMLLSKTETVQTPKVVTTGEADRYQFILMEFFDADIQSETYWSTLGKQLAKLHRKSNDYFGLNHDNYIGSLVQKNDAADSWIQFFISKRLEPLLMQLSSSNSIDVPFQQSMQKIFYRMEELFPVEAPSLLHGDLWSGNVINHYGAPAVIDPAVYYGHREAEIAFTKLFGGFDIAFYEAYSHYSPLEAGFELRQDLYNVYPLLVHAILFGNSYLLQVKRIIKHFE
ncbi:MAG TPA: ketosamine-3-kinase [Cytophagales bacterium]|nr:ketosamine-3-kinase [Cytophagales bacterium]